MSAGNLQEIQKNSNYSMHRNLNNYSKNSFFKKQQVIRIQRMLYHAWITCKFYVAEFQTNKIRQQLSLYFEKRKKKFILQIIYLKNVPMFDC